MAEHAGAVRRREDPRLITGAGEFVDDLRVPGCLHAAMLRSPHAHARIRSIDVSAARRAPGVVGVFVAADLGARASRSRSTRRIPRCPLPCRIRPLAVDRVRFVGEPVAAVIADDPYRANDALDLIRVEYEPLPAIVDVEAALRPDAPILHEDVGSNVVAEWRQRVGDAAAALSGRRRRRAYAHPPRAGRRAPARAARPRRRLGRRSPHRPRRRPDGPPPPRRDRRPARLCPRTTCASSRRPTSAGASAPRGCTTPSTSWWPPSRGASAARSSGSRRGGSTRSSRAWSATRSTTWRSPPRATARCSRSATTSSTTWAPTRSRA